MLRRAGTRDLGLGTAVDEVLLGEFHEEVGIELNVEIQVGRGRLGLLDVEVERGVQQADCFNLVATEAPFELSLQEGVL